MTAVSTSSCEPLLFCSFCLTPATVIPPNFRLRLTPSISVRVRLGQEDTSLGQRTGLAVPDPDRHARLGQRLTALNRIGHTSETSHGESP